MSLLSTFKLSLLALATSAGMGAGFSTFAQYNPNIHNNPGNGMMDNATPYNPAPYNPVAATGSGYTNDGTLMMGGQKIGNPHQILHDFVNPSLFGIDAVRFSYSTNPNYGQGTLAQMENHTQNLALPQNLLFSRLYISPTDPYASSPVGAYPNSQTYLQAVSDARASSYQLTVANDNNLWAFKTLSAPNQQAMNILIKELPNTAAFKANSDPNLGAVGVRVSQNGDAAALQNYFATTKPYDFSWRSAMGAWADGDMRPDNITADMGQFGNVPIFNNEAGAVFTNWVMGSNQVQAYQTNLQKQSAQSGNEAFGVLAWDANQNKYVMLDPTNVTANSGSVSGNMPTLGNNQFGLFGMHTHPGSATPSGQDLRMSQQLGLDQLVIGEDDYSAIFANSPSNNWQGSKFNFEGAREDAQTPGGYGSSNGSHDPLGVGGLANGRGGQYGGNSGNSSIWNSSAFDLWGLAAVRRLFNPDDRLTVTDQDKVNALLLLASAYAPNLANYGGVAISWGTNPNDPNHATRHLTAAGINETAAKDAIAADLKNRNIAGSPTGGLGRDNVVIVNGREISYGAYKFPDGSVNVGSIKVGRR